MEFYVGSAVRVYFIYEAGFDSPVDSNFRKSDLELAILKITVIDQYKLEKGEEVVAQEDIGMKIV